jgi:hypothetical protein
MRAKILIALVMSCALAGCYSSRTVEERQPVVVQQPQPSNTVVVPPGTTVVCPAGSVC